MLNTRRERAGHRGEEGVDSKRKSAGEAGGGGGWNLFIGVDEG